jgi:hypothetical protein
MMISHQRPFSIMYDILSLTNSTLLTADIKSTLILFEEPGCIFFCSSSLLKHNEFVQDLFWLKTFHQYFNFYVFCFFNLSSFLNKGKCFLFTSTYMHTVHGLHHVATVIGKVKLSLSQASEARRVVRRRGSHIF